MALFILYTYSDIKELREIQNENAVIPFVFSEAKDVLEDNSNVFMDISALIYLLRVNKSDRLAAHFNLREMTDETTIIVEESLADDVLSFFPYLFSHWESFLRATDQNTPEKEQTIATVTHDRQSIYNYNNVDDLKIIIEYANKSHIPIATFSRASGDMKAELEKFNTSAELALLDLTSTALRLKITKT